MVTVTPTGSEGAEMPTRMTSFGSTFTPPCAAGLVKKLMYVLMSVSLPPFDTSYEVQPVRPETDWPVSGMPLHSMPNCVQRNDCSTPYMLICCAELEKRSVVSGAEQSSSSVT